MFHQNAIKQSRLEFLQCIDAYSYYVHSRFTIELAHGDK